MPSNIEIKARLRDPTGMRAVVERLSDRPVETIAQHDTFFPSPHGRLKLRQFSPEAGELIFYNRADIADTKQSDYVIAPTSAPERLGAVLSAALGSQQTVVKTRLLFGVGQTRIHLDSVVGVGSFIELEVVLRPDQSPAEGHLIARQLMSALDIRDSDLVECAYADLPLERTKDEGQGTNDE
jgi:adenylate cyclase class IV